jgi:hypothetical protein
MDDGWDEKDKAKHHVDDRVFNALGLEEDSHWRQEDGQNNEQDLHASPFLLRQLIPRT